jgi:hypothetical protein
MDTNHHIPLRTYSHVMSGLGAISTVVFNLMILMTKTLFRTSALSTLGLIQVERTILLSSAPKPVQSFPAWGAGPFVA